MGEADEKKQTGKTPEKDKPKEGKSEKSEKEKPKKSKSEKPETPEKQKPIEKAETSDKEKPKEPSQAKEERREPAEDKTSQDKDPEEKVKETKEQSKEIAACAENLIHPLASSDEFWNEFKGKVYEERKKIKHEEVAQKKAIFNKFTSLAQRVSDKSPAGQGFSAFSDVVSETTGFESPKKTLSKEIEVFNLTNPSLLSSNLRGIGNRLKSETRDMQESVEALGSIRNDLRSLKDDSDLY